ncbi:hypothetical protein BRC88_10285 [Halobacteriales archaeon QS_4_69_225]|nr:MAG: hypothetical protein BRC88_10285 [Halobacteriales archaeon QS_4_69_225]
MDRRRFLAGATTAALTTAGCLDGGASEDPTASPTTSDAPTRLVATSFEVTDVDCGDGAASHEADTGDGRVVVDGVVGGADACHTAELVGADYDRAADTLKITVAAVRGDGDDNRACAGCLVDIEYVATFAFENGEPGSVTVRARGAT